jgi:ABC-type Mn2+/Zn2+ transport system ATPase subunit
VFKEGVNDIISREILVDVVRRLIMPTVEKRLYPLIIGEHGTGKTSLIKLAVDSMKEPKGVIYVDMPLRCDLEVHVAKAVQQALGWIPDQVIDSGERNYSNSLPISIT